MVKLLVPSDMTLKYLAPDSWRRSFPFPVFDTCSNSIKSMGRFPFRVKFASDHISLSDHLLMYCPLMFCVSSLYEYNISAVSWVLFTTVTVRFPNAYTRDVPVNR